MIGSLKAIWAKVAKLRGDLQVNFGSYILRRVIYALIVLFVIITVNFFIFRVMPGDPVKMIIDPKMKPEVREALYEQYGLKKPMSEQYFLYLKNLLTLNLGLSFTTSRPIMDELLERLPNTLKLLGIALILEILIGVSVGIFAASKRGSAVETFVTSAGLFTHAVPGFFFQLILLLLFGFLIPIFPIRGTMSAPPPVGAWAQLLDRIHHLILPVFSLVIINFGYWALYTRNAMVEALGQDYIVTARAKGLSKKTVLRHHAFRSILPPIITIIFLSLPGIISGAVVTETIFSWFGVGRYLLDAVLKQDYPAAQGAFYFIALLTIISNFVADIVYGLVDPRIRVGGGEGK